jgi:hypothetical protein
MRPTVIVNALQPEIGPSRERIFPDVKPGDVYVFQHPVGTRAGHVHSRGTELKVLDSTTKCRHGEISQSGRNWVCESIYGVSEWATLEQCISRGLLAKKKAE